MADREPPDVDVPALTAMLDGKYAEIREMTRKNLAEYAGVLDDAIEMPRDEFRDRVLELVRLMAVHGGHRAGLPDRVRRRRRHRGLRRCLRDAGLR